MKIFFKILIFIGILLNFSFAETVDPVKELNKQIINLEKKGYEIIEIDDTQNELIKTTSEKLIKKYPNKKIQDINLFCIKNSKEYNL